MSAYWASWVWIEQEEASLPGGQIGLPATDGTWSVGFAHSDRLRQDGSLRTIVDEVRLDQGWPRSRSVRVVAHPITAQRIRLRLVPHQITCQIGHMPTTCRITRRESPLLHRIRSAWFDSQKESLSFADSVWTKWIASVLLQRQPRPCTGDFHVPGPSRTEHGCHD